MFHFQIYFYMPSLPSVGGENIMIPATENYKPVEYTDLNLPPNDDDGESSNESTWLKMPRKLPTWFEKLSTWFNCLPTWFSTNCLNNKGQTYP